MYIRKVKVCEICLKADQYVSINKEFNKTLCPRHYTQLKRHGRIFNNTSYDNNEYIVNGNDLEIKIFRNNGGFISCFIDNDDFNKVKQYKWFYQRDKIYTKIGEHREPIQYFILGYKLIPNKI